MIAMVRLYKMLVFFWNAIVSPIHSHLNLSNFIKDAYVVRVEISGRRFWSSITLTAILVVFCFESVVQWYNCD